jgi:D-sedoheptulose 7-phosphate isomerase
MPSEIREATLAARCQEFADMVARCQITAMNGVAFALEAGMTELVQVLERARSNRASVYVIGNGGSAAVASHLVNDLVKVAHMRASTLHDPSLLTCLANDYGYDNAYAQALVRMALPGDVLIAISSSGRSMNIRNAAAQLWGKGGTVVTLSGFSPENALRGLGDLNVWVDSSDYGMVEVGHQFILHHLSDRLGASLQEQTL